MRYEVGDVLVVGCFARKQEIGICISRMIRCDYDRGIFDVQALYTGGSECRHGCGSVGTRDLKKARLLYRGKGEVKVEV